LARILVSCAFEAAEGWGMEARELLRNPRFVAIWVGIWVCMLLAIENIIVKINLLMQMGD
jgi:hypothetical protein